MLKDGCHGYWKHGLYTPHATLGTLLQFVFSVHLLEVSVGRVAAAGKVLEVVFRVDVDDQERRMTINRNHRCDHNATMRLLCTSWRLRMTAVLKAKFYAIVRFNMLTSHSPDMAICTTFRPVNYARATKISLS